MANWHINIGELIQDIGQSTSYSVCWQTDPWRTYIMWSLYELIHIWTAVVDESEEASHQYRGGHRFESRWSPDFFGLLSNCLNWKIYCNDHSSLPRTYMLAKWQVTIRSNILLSCSDNLPGKHDKSLYRVHCWVKTINHLAETIYHSVQTIYRSVQTMNGSVQTINGSVQMINPTGLSKIL